MHINLAISLIYIYPIYQTNHIVHFAYSSYKQVIIYSIIDLGSVQYRKTDDIQNDNSNYSFEKRLCGTNFAHLLRRFDPAIKHNSPLANTHHIALNSFRGVRSPIAEGETIRLSLSRRHLGRMHTTPFPRRRGQRGDAGVQSPEAFNVQRESFPPLAPSSPPCGGDKKKRGRAMKLSHVDGMKKWMPCDGQRLISDVRKQL